MKTSWNKTALVLLFALPFDVLAATLYVDLNSSSPIVPYSSWATAATNIQEAIDAATDGDVVLVTNGVYAAGGKVMAGDLTNRVTIYKAITVQSVNGWAGTVIQGQKDLATNGPTAVRCAWLTNGAVLDGFTLRDGATRAVGDQFTLRSGGGVWAASTNPIVSNCLIVDNDAHYGGGAFRGWFDGCTIQRNVAQADGGGGYSNVFYRCVVTENWARINGGGLASGGGRASVFSLNVAATGGGVYGAGTLVNCTISANRGNSIGGIFMSGLGLLVTNCIIWGNQPQNYSGGTILYTCSSPLPSGTGNIASDPMLLADGIHIASNSPCRLVGFAGASGVDVDGQAWNATPSLGADEWQTEPAVSRVMLGFDSWGQVRFSGFGIGQSPFTYQWMKDGVILANGGNRSGVDGSDLVLKPPTPNDLGNYQLVASNTFGVVTSQVAQLNLRFVDGRNPTPVPPFANWATSANNLQDAVDAARGGDVILVASGIYGRGGKIMAGDLTNRVALNNSMALLSVDGPASTIIQGAWDYVTTNGLGAVRGVWLGEGTTLAGFTVRGGGTRGLVGSAATLQAGGGIWCNSTNVLVIGCTIEGNAAGSGGGGGIFNGTCRSSVIRRNSSTSFGAGALFSTLVNCTVTENQCSSTANTGSGVASNRVYNSIIWGNTRVGSFTLQEHIGAQLTNSCTRPLPAGTGNISAEPMLDSDGIHLLAGSPCVSAGSVAWTAGLDFDGQSWSNPPAMGCDQRSPQLAVTPPLLVANGDGKIRLRVEAVGTAPITNQWFKDGVILANDAHLTGAQSAELAISAFGPADFGSYHMVSANGFGAVTTAVTQVRARFVDPAAITPAPPFTNWATAATALQAVIDVAEYGDLIVVADGVHASGGRVVAGDLTNRVVLTKAVLVSSLNGPDSAIIEGDKDLVGPNGNGNSAVRPVWMESWTSLAGFTIRDGATRTSGDVATLQSGGGVWAFGGSANVLGCVLTNNSAQRNGGGAFAANLMRCTLVGNTATNGGGIYGGSATYTYITKNWALSRGLFEGGGGAYGGTLRNSTIHQNHAFNTGNIASHNGGVSYCNLYNCSVTENDGQGIFFGSAYNTVSWGNTVRDYSGSLSMHYSCANFAVANYGTNNLYLDPQLVDAFHLSENSPVRGAGGPLFVSGTDIDGDLWGNPVSIGADEFVTQSITGALSVSIELPAGPIYPNRTLWLFGRINGRAARVEWTFETGGPQTNLSYAITRSWPAPGNYPITFQAFNESNPEGVAATVNVEVVAVPAPNWASIENLGYQRFYINTTVGVTNHIEFATNLAPPVVWLPLKTSVATNVLMREFDFESTNAARFYRIRSE